MIKQFLTVSAILLCFTAVAQLNLPAPSSTQTIRQDFGMGRIELTYSRPSIKGRTLLKEGSELVPLGRIWRTGANAATKIRFTDKVSIGNSTLDSGTYVLYTLPDKNEWEIILNKGISNWGTDGYKQTDDVARVKVPVATSKTTAETFTMQFTDVTPESCKLELLWGTASVHIPIKTEIRERLKTQVNAALKAEKAPYFQIATYFYEWEKDYPRALDNINKAIESTPNGYYLYLTKARIQKDMGDKAGAKLSAAKCVELATTAKNEDYVNFAQILMKGI